MPWDVWKGVVKAAHGALEEDHSQSGFEDLLVLLVAVEGCAELGDGGVAVAHDVVVDGVVADVVCRFVVLRRDAEAAVEIALVGLKCWKDQGRACGAVLIGVEDWKDARDDVGDEVVEEALIVVVELDCDLADGLWCAVIEVEGVQVEGLLGQRFSALGLGVDVLKELAFLWK